MEQLGVPPALVKAIFPKKKLGASELLAALGTASCSRSKVNWGHHHEIGLIGEFNISTKRDGGVRITGRYGDLMDDDSRREQ
jgi:hypothetical protein